jgi:hypothetical protein
LFLVCCHGLAREIVGDVAVYRGTSAWAWECFRHHPNKLYKRYTEQQENQNKNKENRVGEKEAGDAKNCIYVVMCHVLQVILRKKVHFVDEREVLDSARLSRSAGRGSCLVVVD